MPQGFGIEYKGESRQFVHEGSSLMITFALAIIVIFLVLAGQFESVRDPLVIMVSVPLAISGALLPLALGLGDAQHLQPGRVDHAGRPDHQARHPDLRSRQGAAGEGRHGSPRRRARGRKPAPAPDPDDHGRHGGRPGPASQCHRRRRRQPVRHRRRHRVRPFRRNACSRCSFCRRSTPSSRRTTARPRLGQGSEKRRSRPFSELRSFRSAEHAPFRTRRPPLRRWQTASARRDSGGRLLAR